MVINLSPGDELVIHFKDTDGEFRIHFDNKTYPNAVVVEETAGLPDGERREGILYLEDFSETPEETINDLGLTRKHKA